MIAPELSAPDLALAQAALACGPMADALSLAEWVGDGRELTGSGVPRPAVAAEACRSLGMEMPAGALRSARDVPQLVRAWETAVAAGFIETSGTRARAAANLPWLRSAQLDPGAAQQALEAWVRAVCVMLYVPYDPCPYCLTALHELSLSDGAVDMTLLADAVRSALPHGGEAEEHVASAVNWMTAFGATVTGPSASPGGAAELTPLGRFLDSAVIVRLTPAPDDGAEELLATVMLVPPKIAAAISVPWFEARSATEAVRELLAFAADADPAQRAVALSLARKRGDAAADVWRGWAALPGFGAYARAWLAEHGEPVAAEERDEAWLAAETMSLAVRTVPEELLMFVLVDVARQTSARDVTDVLADIGTSGHPDAELVAGMLSAASSVAV